MNVKDIVALIAAIETEKVHIVLQKNLWHDWWDFNGSWMRGTFWQSNCNFITKYRL